MENKHRLNEEDIFSMISTLYIEEFNMRRYRVDFAYRDNSDLVESYYLKMSDREREIIRKLKSINNGKWEFLENKLLRVGESEFVERCKRDECVPKFFIDEYVIEDCDLDDHCLKFNIKVSFPSNGQSREATLKMNEKRFHDLLRLHIKHHNKLSVTNLIYELPEYAAYLFKSLTIDSMMAYAVDEKNNDNGVYYGDLIIEMTDIKEVTDSIMNPQRDVLHLFSEHHDELKDFLNKYAIQ